MLSCSSFGDKLVNTKLHLLYRLWLFIWSIHEANWEPCLIFGTLFVPKNSYKKLYFLKWILRFSKEKLPTPLHGMPFDKIGKWEGPFRDFGQMAENFTCKLHKRLKTPLGVKIVSNQNHVMKRMHEWVDQTLLYLVDDRWYFTCIYLSWNWHKTCVGKGKHWQDSIYQQLKVHRTSSQN